MTKLVKFTRPMRPFSRGDTRAVPDDVAEKLVADGDATIEASVFDVVAAETKKKQRYMTRGK